MMREPLAASPPSGSINSTRGGSTTSRRGGIGMGSIMSVGEPPVRGSLPPGAATKPAATKRLQCLDSVRGLNVMLMVFVDNTGGYWQAWIDHSPWDVVHLADFVMPLFLFMVGVSMAFAMKKYSGALRARWARPCPSRTLNGFGLRCGRARVEMENSLPHHQAVCAGLSDPGM
eukprot:COSAG01_NODE_6024_length_3895_cov_4.417808_1_plen_173_part_00